MKSKPVSYLLFFLIILLLSGNSFAADAQAVLKNYKKAEKLFAASKYAEAVLIYQNVLSAGPEELSRSAIYTRIGDSYFRLEQYRNALDAYRRALREQKRSERPQTQYWIGFCCFLLGRDAEAVHEFLKIPDLYPESGMLVGTAYYWAGRASERMGKQDQAAGYYKRAGGNSRSPQGRVASERARALKEKP